MTPEPQSTAEPILRLRGVGRRFGGLARRARRRPRRRARRAPRHPRPQRRGEDHAVQRHLRGHRRRPPGRSSSRARTSAAASRGSHASAAWAATYQKSRLFLGLTVEDNLYLAVLGTRGGHLQLRAPGRRRRDARARPRGRRARRAHRASSQTLVGSALARRAAPARGRAWPAPPTRKLMLLDEPASGLSRGERVALTDLLLQLDPAITLILIEHDMDVALRVADLRHDDARRPEDRRGHARTRSAPTSSCTSSTSAAASPTTGSRRSHERRAPQGRRPPRLLRARPRAAGRVVRDGPRARLADRPQRHGQDDAVQRDHADARPASPARLDRFDGNRARRPAVLQGRAARASATCRRAGGCSSR